MSNEFSTNDIKNGPLYNHNSRPLALVPHIDSQRSYVNADQITQLAIKVYKTKNGKGLTYPELMDAGLVRYKKQAQKTLRRTRPSTLQQKLRKTPDRDNR